MGPEWRLSARVRGLPPCPCPSRAWPCAEPVAANRSRSKRAYYIDYRNQRAKYVDAFWHLVNWDFVARNFTGP